MRITQAAKAALLGDWGAAKYPSQVLGCPAEEVLFDTGKYSPAVVLLYMDFQVMDKGRAALLLRIEKLETA